MGDNIYVSGGHYGYRGNCTYEKIQVYRPEVNEWSIITLSPHPGMRQRRREYNKIEMNIYYDLNSFVFFQSMGCALFLCTTCCIWWVDRQRLQTATMQIRMNGGQYQ